MRSTSACNAASPFRSRFPLDEQGRCGLCRRGLLGFDAAYSFGFYEDELRELIHLFKYGGMETLAKPLGRLLALALPRQQSFDAIVPMPLHWRKRWRRGFNQAALLAREISRRTHVPVEHALRQGSQHGGASGADQRQAAAQRVRSVSREEARGAARQASAAGG